MNVESLKVEDIITIPVEDQDIDNADWKYTDKCGGSLAAQRFFDTQKVEINFDYGWVNLKEKEIVFSIDEISTEKIKEAYYSGMVPEPFEMIIRITEIRDK